jgi:hypothetical protein
MCRNRSSGLCGPDPTTARSAFRTTHAGTVPACRTPEPGIHHILGVVGLHKLRSRQVQPFPVIIVNLAQPDAVVPTRAGTIANRADDLAPPKLAHRPRDRELLDRHPGKLVSLAAGHAESVRRTRFASASLNTATPEPQQRVIRRWCQCFGCRVPPCGGEKLRVESRPGILGRTLRSRSADRCQHRAHRPSPPASAHAATRSTASRNLCGQGCR